MNDFCWLVLIFKVKFQKKHAKNNNTKVTFCRPSLKIVSLRPDGSIVPRDNSALQHFPSVKEWIPATSEGNTEKSVLSSGEICDIDSRSDVSQSEHNGMDRLGNIFFSSYKSFFQVIYFSEI